jgi:hypothetical protein
MAEGSLGGVSVLLLLERVGAGGASSQHLPNLRRYAGHPPRCSCRLSNHTSRQASMRGDDLKPVPEKNGRGGACCTIN